MFRKAIDAAWEEQLAFEKRHQEETDRAREDAHLALVDVGYAQDLRVKAVAQRVRGRVFLARLFNMERRVREAKCRTS